uniref:Putative tigger transposable element-derived n=1 Tax=Xenopsylla cheopis TaxID=163159 RepID=A0A6M2DLL6_XENCH
MSSKQRRHCLKISEKLQIIELSETHKTSVRDLSALFNCSPFQVCNVIRNKELIKSIWEKYGDNYKKIRKSEKNSDINKIVHLWYQDARSQNLTITDSILKSCARDVAKHLHKKSFRPTNTWVNRFHRQFETNVENVPNSSDLNTLSQKQDIQFDFSKFNWDSDSNSNNNQAPIKLEILNANEMHLDQSSYDNSQDLNIKPGLNLPITIFNDNVNKNDDREVLDIPHAITSTLNTPQQILEEPKPAINFTQIAFDLEAAHSELPSELFDIPTLSVDPQPQEHVTEKLGNINPPTIKSYPELLKNVYTIEDFAMSQNDILLLKLGSVMRYLVEQKIRNIKASSTITK